MWIVEFTGGSLPWIIMLRNIPTQEDAEQSVKWWQTFEGSNQYRARWVAPQ